MGQAVHDRLGHRDERGGQRTSNSASPQSSAAAISSSGTSSKVSPVPKPTAVTPISRSPWM